MDPKEQLVVIGNGMAGIATVEHLLKIRHDIQITIFGSEHHVNYNRVLLSSVLSGEMGIEEIVLNPQEWYEKHHIKLHCGVPVQKIELAGKYVITESGQTCPFDKLLIATGSVPFIPPIKGIGPGNNLGPGIFTFRNIEDTKSIIEWAHKSRKAAVIGGGLLGIEAAIGLARQGLDVTIVHLADRLMEMQVDAAASEILNKEISRRGIRVLLGHSAVEVISSDQRPEGIVFSNGKVQEADMIVIAAGIRPNADLAMESGLAVHRGIVVSDYMQTSHPDIYSVGECTEHRGKVYGLVAPLMEQAMVAADAIDGGRRSRYEGSVVATKLKVAGIPLSSIGNFQGSIGCEELVYSDPGISVYKKIVISGGRIIGAILMGDIEGYNRFFTLVSNKEDISLQRKTLLSGNPDAITSLSAIPDHATICGCMGVSKGTIIAAIEENSLTSIREISEKTRACTSCKGCAPLIEQILQEVLGGEYVKQDRTPLLCDCMPMAWEDIRKDVKALGLKSVSQILETLGNNIGCSTCKPALAYMLTEIYVDAFEKEDDALLVNDQVHANIQKDETFSVVPRIYGGVTTPDQLRKIADVAEKYSVPLLKITGGQRLDMVGIPGGQLHAVWKDLGMPSGHAYTKSVRTCKTCVGDSFCRYGVQDSMAMGILMEQRYQGIPCPGKLKMAVSGCPRNCSEAIIKDIGIIGIQTGWEIYVGGNGGVKTRAADLLTTVSTQEEVLAITDVFLQYYRENARWQERTSHFIERVGIDHVRSIVLEDSAAINKKLKMRMEEIISRYRDPWAEDLQMSSINY